MLNDWVKHPPAGAGDHADLPRAKEAVKIIDSLIQTLIVFHEEVGAIHRDLTPSNIFWARNMDGSGDAFPIDFSCSVRIGADKVILASRSPGYSRPGSDGKDTSVQVDLYSLAALLLVLVTGKKCVTYRGWGVADLTKKVSITEPVLQKKLPHGVKSKLINIVSRAASTHGATPYGSVREMCEDIKVLLEIIDRKGMHPEVLFDASEKEYKKQCQGKHGLFRYKIDPDLLVGAVSSVTKKPVDLWAQNTVLTGGGGAGKTTAVGECWKKALDLWKRAPKAAPIPVFVPLNTFNGSGAPDLVKEDADRIADPEGMLRGGEKYILRYISSHYFPDLVKEDANRIADLEGMLKGGEKYILFLDGINEAVGADALKTEVKALSSIDNVTVLITSRNDLGDGWALIKKRFITAQLEPLADDRIRAKLEKKGLMPPSRRLLETLRRPMFLAMYLRLKITDREVETPGQILCAHHEYLKGSFREGCHENGWESAVDLVMDGILPELATAVDRMVFDRQDVFSCVDAHSSDPQFRDARTFLQKEGKELDKFVLEALFDRGAIREEGQESFAFVHQALLEFYQAFDVYGQMRRYRQGDQLPIALCKTLLPETVLRFLGDLWGEHDHASKKDPFGEASPVEDWLKCHARGRRDDRTRVAVRNLVETMKLSRRGRISADYSELDLSWVSFHDCDLAGSKFDDAVLSDTTFRQTGHYRSADRLAFVHGRPWILTGAHNEKEIYIWDHEQGTYVDKMICEASVVGFDVSDDGKYVAVKEHSDIVEVFSLEDRVRVRKIILGWIGPLLWNMLLEGLMEEYAPEGFDRERPHTMQTYERGVVRFDSTGQKLICSFGPGGTDEVSIWDALNDDDPDPIARFPIWDKYPDGHHVTKECVLSFDRRSLLCISDDGQIAKVMLEKGKVKKCGSVPPCYASGVTLARDSKTMYFLDSEDTLCSADLGSGAVKKLCEAVGHLPVAAKDHLVWAQGSFLTGWDLSREQKEEYGVWHIERLTVDETGNKIAVAFSDGRIMIGDLTDKRFTSGFICGNGMKIQPFVDTKIVRWDEKGIVRQATREQAQCLSGDTGTVISFSDSYYNTFDGPYTISAEIDRIPDGKNEMGDRRSLITEKLVVREALTGAVITVAPWDPMCVAKDENQQEIFRKRSGIRWARYLPEHKKLVVGMDLACVRVWDEKTNAWSRSSGWDEQIRKIMQMPGVVTNGEIGRKAWTLSECSMVIGDHIITGTVDGRILFWDLECRLEQDIHAHSSMPIKIQPIPNSMLFMTYEKENVCIWDQKSLEMVDRGRSPHCTSPGSILGVADPEVWRLGPHSTIGKRAEGSGLVLYAERFEKTVLLRYGYQEKEDPHLDLRRVWASLRGSMTAKSDDGGRIAFFWGCSGMESSIEVYETATGKSICDMKLAEIYKVEATDIRFSPDGEELAIAYRDRSVLILDLKNGSSRVWDTVIARNIANCDFSEAQMSEQLKKLLRQNGAIVD